jgi:drug/metabolite transporter (DMT)-like permease
MCQPCPVPSQSRKAIVAADAGVHRPKTVGLAAVFGAVLFFSISSSVIKWAQTPGAAVALWRMIFAIPVWWAVLLVQRRRGRLDLPTAATFRRVLPAALFFGANIAVFFTVLNKTSIAHAEFIGALSPLLLLPAGALLFREHPNWAALRWGVVSIVGVAIVLFAGGDQGVATVEGDLLMLLVMAFWVGYLLSTKWARGSQIDVIQFMACMMPLALLTTAPIAVIFARDAIWPLSARAWIAVVVLTAITGVAAHGLIVFAQKYVPIATIGVMQVGQPALATFWGWLILGEAIVVAQVPGMVLVVVGLALFTVTGQRRPSLPIVAATPVESRHADGVGGADGDADGDA